MPIELTGPPPRVFVSYAWSSDEHKRWVQQLVTRLRESGVDVLVDYGLRPGNDLNVYMEKMVTDSTVKHVLCVCDTTYASKANCRTGGVGTEAEIITPNLYGKADQEKFVPIFREKAPNGEFVRPAFFGSRIGIDFSDDRLFERKLEELNRLIYDRPILSLPPLGTPPSYLFESAEASRVPHLTYAPFNALTESLGRAPSSLLREYLKRLLEAIVNLPVELDQGEITIISVKKSISTTKRYRDEFVEIVSKLALAMPDDFPARDLARFFEQLATLVSGAASVHEAIAFLTRELFLYCVATLLFEGRYAQLDQVLSLPLMVERRGETTWEGYEVLDCYLQESQFSSNRMLAAEGRAGRISVVADLIDERVDHPDVNVSLLLQAELLLALRSALRSNRTLWSSLWYPRYLIYRGKLSTRGPLPLFAKAKTPEGATTLCLLLGIRDLQQLREFVVSARTDSTWRALGLGSLHGFHFEDLMATRLLFAEPGTTS